jgi:hypothetical protein
MHSRGDVWASMHGSHRPLSFLGYGEWTSGGGSFFGAAPP